MKQKKLPPTIEGINRKIKQMSKSYLNTPEDANYFCRLMLASIDADIKACEGSDNPIAVELLKRYKIMKQNWERRLQYTEQSLENNSKN